MLGISISQKLFGSTSSQVGNANRSREVKSTSEERASNKTTLEEPQSNGTSELKQIVDDASFEIEQKRKDSFVSDFSDESFWISTEAEERLTKVIGNSVWQIASLQQPQRRSTDETKIFEGEIIPQISLGDYLCRLRKYINRLFPVNTSEWGVSPGMRSVVIALIYIDRLLEKRDAVKVTQYNIHRLCMAAVFVAAKYLEDDALPKNFLSNVAGVNKKQLAQIETTFCCKVEFDLRVTEEDFIQTYTMVSKQVLR